MFCSLPAEVWLQLTDYLQLADFPRLQCTSSSVLAILDTSDVYRRRAQQSYPIETLVVENYGGCWKALLRDDNALNGFYVKEVTGCYSQWIHNTPERFYISSVRAMLWDRQRHVAGVIVESFGEDDLRTATTTSVCRKGKPGLITGPFPLAALKIVPITRVKGLRGSSHDGRRETMNQLVGFHDIALLEMSDETFDSHDDFCVLYNGVRYQDYPPQTFFSGFPSLKEFFKTKVEGTDTDYNFVGRDHPILKPSDVLKWDVDLPEQVRSRHVSEAWGNIRVSVKISFKWEETSGSRTKNLTSKGLGTSGDCTRSAEH